MRRGRETNTPTEVHRQAERGRARSAHSDKQTLSEEVAAWENDRNKAHSKADWHFTTDDARVKLKRQYPAM
jgi:hypothetical protein